MKLLPCSPEPSARVDALATLLSLHAGEIEALSQCLAVPRSVLPTDDTAARLAARKLGVSPPRHFRRSGSFVTPEPTGEASGSRPAQANSARHQSPSARRTVAGDHRAGRGRRWTPLNQAEADHPETGATRPRPLEADRVRTFAVCGSPFRVRGNYEASRPRSATAARPGMLSPRTASVGEECLSGRGLQGYLNAIMRR